MAILEHSLTPYFEEFVEVGSLEELKRLPSYQKLKPRIDAIMNTVVLDNSAENLPAPKERIRAVAWNIERGIEFEGIVQVFKSHPVLAKSDLLFLTELDYGMARSGNRRVPVEFAEALGMNYAFAPSYLNLEKGSGLEASIGGENLYGIHGNALYSSYPILEARSVSLPNGKDKMKGKEKRLGCQRAVIALVNHPEGPFRAVSAHLDAHSTQKHRMRQMQLILDELDRFHPNRPALIGGDWNTSTYNSRNAVFSILGYVRRVLMGVRRVIKLHYPYPDRWFERHLFRELERRGYRYQDLNEPGGCTLHYHIEDLAANGRMADWIPNWCFWFINWALEKNDGKCSFKLDWFAGRDIKPSAEFPPRVVADVHSHESPLSDHDPIVLDFKFQSPR